MKKINIDIAFARANGRLRRQIDRRADEADQRLDELVELMTLRSDYEHLRFKALEIMPLGIQSFGDLQGVRLLARAERCDHIADALIEELTLKGAGNALNRLNIALASIIAA